MDKVLQEKIEAAIWIGKNLFSRNKTSGSSANMSFMHKGDIYITGSGESFGKLTEKSFAIVNKQGENMNEVQASKELPLHQIFYEKDPDIQAVIHTHSFYSTLWSCLEHENPLDVIPNYTPYLKMKVGTIGLIPYEHPGSQELFEAFKEKVTLSDGYLLQNHGPVIGDQDLMSAFYGLEELEESAKIAWHLWKKGIKEIDH